MKIIEKLFGKKEKSSGSITLDMLPEWLESRSGEISEKIGRDASSFYPEIEKTLRKIKKSTSELEEANPEGRFHLKMVKIAASNRDNMAKQVRVLLENITVPPDKDLKTIMAFHEGAVQTLAVCLDNMMKSYQYTKLVFFEESKSVISDVNSLGRLLNDIIEPVNSNKQMLDVLDKSKEMIRTLKETTLEIGSMEKSIERNEEKSVSLKKEMEEKQKALDILLGSEPWNRYVISRDEMILLEKEAENKLSEINSIISPLNKVINRLKQLSDSGRHTLKPQDRDALNLCLSCPVDVPPEFFIELKKVVESGILNIPKTDKIIPQIHLAASSLGEKKNEYQSILKKIELKKDEISKMKIIKEEKHLRDMLSVLQENLTMIEKELDVSRKRLDSLRPEVESKKHKLQDYISVIDSKTKIS